jgi:hypothetical protein
MPVYDLLEVINLLDWLVKGYGGWRYLLSAQYRQHVHQRWQQQSKVTVCFDIMGSIIAFLFTWLLVGGLGWLLFFKYK